MNGRNILERIYNDLYVILTAEGLEKHEILSLKGKIVTGLGEGAYYMSLDGYKSQFASILGFIPFPGYDIVSRGHYYHRHSWRRPYQGRRYGGM